MGQSPRLFELAQRLSPTRRIQTFVGRDTDICIDAPSGSGNSYFVNGFRKINPGVRMAHHHHVAAQVMMGVHFQVPTVVILRDPVACVVSRTAFWNTLVLIAPIFRQWIRFFRTVEGLQDRVLVASFESVTRRQEMVINAINARFETEFNTRFPEMEHIAADMDRSYAKSTGGAEKKNPNLPGVEKETVKDRFRSRVAAHRLAQPARDLYARLDKIAL